MSNTQIMPWILFPLYIERPRAFSFRGAIDDGLEPREYRSMLHEEPMEAEAVLDFKIWGKSPCLTCYFRNIRTGEKFCLTAFDNKRSTRYTPRDNEIDFSEQGIEHGLYHVRTVKTKKGTSAWATAKLLIAPGAQLAIEARIAQVFVGCGMW